MRRLVAACAAAAVVVTGAPFAGYEAAAAVIDARIVVPASPALVVPAPVAAAPLSGASRALPAPSLSASAPALPVSALSAAAAAAAPAAAAEMTAAAEPSAGSAAPSAAAAASSLAASAAANAAPPAAAPGGPGASQAWAWAARGFDALEGGGPSAPRGSPPARAGEDAAPQIAKHDGHRLEVKLAVRLVPGKKNVYRVSTYFFVPHALGITPAAFSKETFYRHIQRRIRFATPRMSLGEILDPRNETSPLTRLSAVAPRLGPGAQSGAAAATAYAETRMLGAIASVFLREQVAALSAGLPEAAGTAERRQALREQIDALSRDSARLLIRVRETRTRLAQVDAPVKVRETAAFLDEFLSLCVAEQFVRLLTAIRKDPALSETLADADRRIAALVKSEDAYRAAAGLPTVVDKASSSEALFYRRAVLKNLFYSVLDLGTKTSEWSGVYQVLFAACAGLASLAYFISMQAAQGHLSAGGAALLVFGMAAYMVKDRLKDLLKIWSIRRWNKYFSDAVTAIRDPATGRVVGKMRESFGFVPPGDVPPDVLRRRQADPLASISVDGKPEDVLRYDKEVTLKSGLIEKAHTRRRDLNDFLLVNLLPFLVHTEDPEVGFTYLDPASGRLETLPGSQVYHVNMVTHYEARQPAQEAASSYQRLRIVMDREGIKRIEEVPVP